MRVFSSIVLIAFTVGVLVAQEGPSVVSVPTFLHIVSDLDQSLEFYHGTLGLELTGHAVPPKMLDNPAVADMYGVPGQQYRAAVVKVPGSSLNLEFVQWGPARAPEHKPVADPGAATLILHRTDAENTGKTLQDPDGFPIQIVRSDTPGAELSFSVIDIQKTSNVFTTVLGFKPDGDWFTVPGGSTRVRLTQASSTVAIRFPSPGRASLRLSVHDAAGLATELASAGLAVVTTSGVPVKLPYNGPYAIILREPSSFGVQLVEAK